MASSFKEILGRTAKTSSSSTQRQALDSASRAARDAFDLTMDGMIGRLLDALFKGAEGAMSSDEERRLMASYSVLYENRPSYITAVRKHLDSTFAQAIQDFLDRRSTIAAIKPAATNELALVEDEELDRFVLARRLGSRLEHDFADALRELNGRLASVAGLLEIAPGSNPLRPELIVLALEDAWRDVRRDPRHDGVVLQCLTPSILGDLGKVYAAASGALADAGYSIAKAGVVTGVQRTTATRPKPASVSLGEAPLMPAAQPGFFRQLTQLLTRAAQGGRMGSPLTTVPNVGRTASQAATATTPQAMAAFTRLVPEAARPTAERPALVPTLSHLQRAQFEQPLEFGQAMSLSPIAGPDGQPASNYMDPMSQVDVALATPLRFINVIRNIADTGIVAHASEVDGAVIELVARLFDFVFEDKNLHDAIKVLLSRLQIPVLKAAMLDTAFFEREDHPARRLVNVLADAGLGWEEYDGREDPLYQLIDRTVQRVLEEFGEDLSLFERLADDVETYVDQYERESNVAAAPEIAAKQTEARQQEDVELSTRLARRAVDERLRESPPPLFVSIFLRRTWADHLGLLLAMHEPDAPEVENALQTADDLLWSVTPKRDPEARRELLVKMPDLQRQLRNGAQHASMPTSESNSFFLALEDRWAGAIVGEEIVVADAVEEALAEATSEPLPDTAMNTVLELNPAAIVELTKDDGTRVCYKLGWISENKTRFLLTNRLNSAPLIVSPEHLAERLRAGKLRIIERGPIVERALNSILSALQEVRYQDA
ncbi:MAG TPA: DUF1631 family protein [Burkholderiaceae bacterium]|nr:DUF1631 family protein [Burkholderiaceae bacterium]